MALPVPGHEKVNRGQGNSIMVCVSIFQTGRSGFKPGISCVLQKGGILSCYQLVSTRAAHWFTIGLAMCYHVYVMIHVTDP